MPNVSPSSRGRRVRRASGVDRVEAAASVAGADIGCRFRGGSRVGRNLRNVLAGPGSLVKRERRAVTADRHLAGVRAVVFDAVGTLITPDPPAPAVYSAVGRRHGS